MVITVGVIGLIGFGMILYVARNRTLDLTWRTLGMGGVLKLGPPRPRERGGGDGLDDAA